MREIDAQTEKITELPPHGNSSPTTYVQLLLLCFHKNNHCVKDLGIVDYRRCTSCQSVDSHDDVIKWKHFPRYWPFVWGIHRSSVNSPHKGQWRGALMFSLICAWINRWVNNRQAGDLRHHCAHYDVIVIQTLPTARKTRQFLLHCQDHGYRWTKSSAAMVLTCS